RSSRAWHARLSGKRNPATARRRLFRRAKAGGGDLSRRVVGGAQHLEADGPFSPQRIPHHRFDLGVRKQCVVGRAHHAILGSELLPDLSGTGRAAERLHVGAAGSDTLARARTVFLRCARCRSAPSPKDFGPGARYDERFDACLCRQGSQLRVGEMAGRRSHLRKDFCRHDREQAKFRLSRGSQRDLLQRTTNTSLPRKWRDWLTSCVATASLSLYFVTSGGRTAPILTSSTMRSRCGRSRPTLGRSAVTSDRSGFGACAPEAMKAARPPGLSTAKERCATSPPTVSNTASTLRTAVVKSVLL